MFSLVHQHVHDAVTVEENEDSCWVDEGDPIISEIIVSDSDVTIRLLLTIEACEIYGREWENEDNYEKEMGLSLSIKLSNVFAELVKGFNRLTDSEKQEILSTIIVAEQIISKARASVGGSLGQQELLSR